MIENLKFKIRNSRKGFTIIELMVVIAIVGILAAIALVNMGRNPERDVQLEKDRLISFLREVQNKALTAEKISPAPSGKICGFGVRVSNPTTVQSYYVGTDLNADCSSKVRESGTVYSDPFMPRTDGVSITLNGSSLFFLIPYGEVFLNGTVSSAIFTIAKSGQSVTVEVTKAGIIE